jgi:hypothetical protein
VRPPLWRLLVVLLAAAAYPAGLLVLSASGAPKGKLTGLDMVVLPGTETKLRAKLEYDGPGFLNPDIEGAEIDFLIEDEPLADPAPASGPALKPDRPLGSARTDGDGFAELAFKSPQKPGHYKVKVLARDPERLKLEVPATFLLAAVTPADQSIVICDIDNTICLTDLSDTIADQPQKVPPLPGAPEALARITAAKHQVVYLTARPKELVGRTRRWLAHHRFPSGVILPRDLSSEYKKLRLTEAGYKRAALEREILSRWKKIPWGIGNTATDRDAYGACGIPAVLIDPEGKVEVEAGGNTRAVKSWDEAGKLILGES